MSAGVPTTAETAAGEPDEPVAAPRRLLGGSTTPILLILAAMLVIFAALRFEQFASVPNLRNVATDASVLLILAVGSTFVIVTAGIDLSVGSVLVFSGVVGAKLMESIGGDGWGVTLAGLGACLASGLAWGALNGVLVAKARIPALIVTLGTLGMSLGFALLLTNGVDVRSVPETLTAKIGIGRLFGQVPYLVIVAALVAVAGGIALGATRFGRYTYAIGSNAEAARRAGIDIERHLVKVYGLAGLLAGLAGFLSLARFSTTTIAGHSTDNLQAIAAVVIGGTSLFGGIGTMLGTAVGVFIPAVLANGFVIVDLQPFWQQVAVGAVLIVAVYLDQLRRRSQFRN